MAITKEAEKLISQLENSPEGRKHGRQLENPHRRMGET